MAVDIAALGSELERWEIAGYVATAIVLIGVVGESVVEFTKWLKGPCKALVGTASSLILVAGLAGEILTQVKANTISGQMIAFLNDQSGAAVKQAALLGVTVDNLAGFVRQKNAEAQNVMNRLTASRALSGEQMQRAVAILKRYPIAHANIMPVWSSQEVVSFSTQIETMLDSIFKARGLVDTPDLALVMMMPPLERAGYNKGVRIEYGAHNPFSRRFAEQLAAVLVSDKIAAKAVAAGEAPPADKYRPAPDTVGAAMVEITVGEIP